MFIVYCNRCPKFGPKGVIYHKPRFYAGLNKYTFQKCVDPEAPEQ